MYFVTLLVAFHVMLIQKIYPKLWCVFRRSDQIEIEIRASD